MQLDNLTVSHHDGVATLVIDRPSKLNALNAQTLSELEQAFDAVAADDAVRGVIVTGAGDKAFVAGADIGELAKETATSGHLAARRGQDVFRKIETSGKPVVAAINGFALGGGLELALACHLRVASDRAKLGLPEVSLGIIPGYGGTQRLARLVGRGRALELILTGAHVDAAEAHRIGLVNRVVPAAELLEQTEKLIRSIIDNAPVALRHALLAVDQGLDIDQEKAMLIEAVLFGILFGTDDLREGMAAFMEKRKAEFKGK
jgi:enoyl-CoA hydratase